MNDALIPITLEILSIAGFAASILLAVGVFVIAPVELYVLHRVRTAARAKALWDAECEETFIRKVRQSSRPA